MSTTVSIALNFANFYAPFKGYAITVQDAKYMVHIRLELLAMGRLRGVVCSGMILTRVQILTAAHCFDATPHMSMNRMLHIREILRSEVVT